MQGSSKVHPADDGEVSRSGNVPKKLYPFPKAFEVEPTNTSGEKFAMTFGAAAGAGTPSITTRIETHTDAFATSNRIITSQYTVLNFIPKSLFSQFRRVANFYFLIMSLVMLVGEHTSLYPSPISSISTLGFLIAILAFTMFFQAIDDIERHREDKHVDNRVATTIEERKSWKHVAMGDVVIIGANEEVPADVLLLSSSNTNGTVYVETSNIDGETMLKIRQPIEILSERFRSKGPDADTILGEIATFGGTLEMDVPSRNIECFEGVLTNLTVGCDTLSTCSMGTHQLLLRGSIVKNVAWCAGLVVAVGSNTKVALNAMKTPTKMSNVDKVVNNSMIVILSVMFVLVAITSVAGEIMWYQRDSTELHWYLFPNGDVHDFDMPSLLANFFVYFILYTNMVPLSMFITLDALNFVHAIFINRDEQMVDVASGTAAKVRTSNLCSELGQVQHIFSDKTGTLTRNEMRLDAMCVVDGSVWNNLSTANGLQATRDFWLDRSASPPSSWPSSDDGRGDDERDQLGNLLRLVTLCHTVVAEKRSGGISTGLDIQNDTSVSEELDLKLNAESPDEAALVKAAASIGVRFAGRTNRTITIVTGRRRVEKYDVLAVNAFDSSRKRMSVVVRRSDRPKGPVLLLCKGADSVIFERCTSKGKAELTKQVDNFAMRGLRTLVLAKREISNEEIQHWLRRYESAMNATDAKTRKLREIADAIERNMTLVGATAIEDRLQDNVPRAISNIRRAGIKIWVLTGDKMETAISIGRSSNILSTKGALYRVRGDSKLGVSSDLKRILTSMRGDSISSSPPGLVISGQSLLYVLDDEDLKRQLVEIARPCSSLIACRLSPRQKAELVRLVKLSHKIPPVTLAIGDGANDVSMIKEAHVGVGISGHEGLQSSNSADFSISQFSFLERLLFVHGRTDYFRVSRVILFCFFKNIALVMVLFFYNFSNGFSGQPLFEDWLYVNFNAFTFFAPFLMGVFDSDVDIGSLANVPEFYVTGREQKELNKSRTIAVVALSLLTSVVVYAIPYISVSYLDIDAIGDVYSFGVCVFNCLFVSISICAVFWTSTWNAYVVLGHIASAGLLLAFYLIHGYFVCLTFSDPSPFFYGIPGALLRSAYFWLVTLCASVWTIAVHTIAALYNVEILGNRDVGRIVRELEESLSAKPSSSSSKDGGVNGSFSPKKGIRNIRGMFHRSLSGRLGMQQSLSNAQVTCTSRSLFILLIVLGSVSLVSWGILSSASNNAYEFHVMYEAGHDAEFSIPSGVHAYDATSACDVGMHGASCNVSFFVPRRTEGPVWLMYRLTNTHQNHNAYFESRDSLQMRGETGSNMCALMDEHRSGIGRTIDDCDPSTEDGCEYLSPCGLVAQTLFNDTFRAIDRSSCTCASAPPAALPSDFDCSACVHVTPLLLSEDVVNAHHADFFKNDDDYPFEPHTRYLYERFPNVVNASQGITSHAAITWLQPAALSDFKKRYARIRVAGDDDVLQANTQISLEITSNFPAADYAGTKSVVLLAGDGLRNSDTSLASLFLITAIFCFGFAASAGTAIAVRKRLGRS